MLDKKAIPLRTELVPAKGMGQGKREANTKQRVTELHNQQNCGRRMALGSELSIIKSIQAREGEQLSGKAQTMFMAGS